MKRYLYTEHDNGTVNKIPLSESEYQSIKWDWQIKLDELWEHLWTVTSIKNSMDTLNELSMTGPYLENWWDKEVEIAKKAYEDYDASINKDLYFP